MYVRMYIGMHACMHVCVYTYMYTSAHAHLHVVVGCEMSLTMSYRKVPTVLPKPLSPSAGRLQ